MAEPLSCPPENYHNTVNWVYYYYGDGDDDDDDDDDVTSVVSDSVRPHGLQPTRLLRPWDSAGKNTGVCCHFLLQLKGQTQVNKRKLKVEEENLI